MVELDTIPLYEFHTLYYQFWKDKQEEAKLTDDERAGVALGKMIEDNL